MTATPQDRGWPNSSLHFGPSMMADLWGRSRSCTGALVSNSPPSQCHTNQGLGLPGGKETQVLPHGSPPQVLTDEFRLDYCRLWQSLIWTDMEKVKKYSQRLGAGGLYPLFACMLTARSWDSVNRGIGQAPVTATEVGMLLLNVRGGARGGLWTLSSPGSGVLGWWAVAVGQWATAESSWRRSIPGCKVTVSLLASATRSR